MSLPNSRPSWDEYFLRLAFDVSLRSDDCFIKHGSVLVDNNTKHIIGTGYNNTFRGADLEVVQPENRDTRRVWMIHSEENAIFNCEKNPLTLSSGATLYVTGPPCVNCLQRIINFGITRVVYADRQATITENGETNNLRKNILSMSKIKLEPINMNNPWIKQFNV